MANVSPNKREITMDTDGTNKIEFVFEYRSPDQRLFSVTLTDPDNDWGEFFSKEDAAVLYLWLGEKLREIV